MERALGKLQRPLLRVGREAMLFLFGGFDAMHGLRAENARYRGLGGEGQSSER
jgi:hypothetical protein